VKVTFRDGWYYAVWLYFRFPLGLRLVEEMLAARGIIVSHETVRQWGLKFGPEIAARIRRWLPRGGDKWHLDEVVITIAGKKHTCGAPSTKTGSCWRFWCKAGATRRRPSACFVSC